MPDSVAGAAGPALLLVAVVPALATAQNWYQGLLVRRRLPRPYAVPG